MTLPNETIATGGEPRCGDCQTMLKLAVHRSGAGFYVGTWCLYAPCPRESGYYTTREAAAGRARERRYGRP